MTERSRPGGDIFVIDDDAAVRDALTLIFSAAGYEVICLADSAALFALARTRTPSCILVDLHISAESGLDILKELRRQHYPAPVFMISGQGDIASAVSAIKLGALDFIQKPFTCNEIVSLVEAAIGGHSHRQPRAVGSPIASLRGSAQDLLTQRESEVLKQIARGASNKDAGRSLGISPRTIEDHRARIMRKLGARNTADLVRLSMTHSHVA